MNLLSLDQSSRITGYAIFKENKLIKVGHFEANSNDLADRLVDIKQHIINLINVYDIDMVAFEDVQLQETHGKEIGVKTFKILAEVLGVVHELICELNIDYYIIPPIVWKATIKIAGKGRAAEKKAAQKYVLNNYNISCTEDEADAVCIGHHIIQKEKTEFNWV